MRTIKLENYRGVVIEVILDYKSNLAVIEGGEGVPLRLKGKLTKDHTERDDKNFKIDLDHFFKYYPEYNIPNNKLSRVVYKNMVPSKCGNYLENKEEK